MGDNINGITRILELFYATFVINVLRNDMDIEVLWMLKNAGCGRFLGD